MRIFIELMFWLTAAVCGIAGGVISTGGSKWWIAALGVSAFIGGAAFVLKSVLDYPQEVKLLLKQR